MSDNSKIEWTDATWQPVTGCSIVSPGCANCYAMKLAGTRLRHHPSRVGLTVESKAGPVWNGKVRFNEQWLDQPLRWKSPRRIFVCAHGDLFHESVPDEWIDMVFAVMALAPRHTFQVLTKRSVRMREYLAPGHDELSWRWLQEAKKILGDEGGPVIQGGWPLPNVWLGVSTERQQEAYERIPDLLQTPAVVRFISAEPLLGPINLEPWLPWPDDAPDVNDKAWGCQGCDEPPAASHSCGECPATKSVYAYAEGLPDSSGCPEWMTETRVTIDWVIVGGESGTGARPMHPDWARSLRDRCAAAGVPFFFKQWGSHAPKIDDDPALAGKGFHMRPSAATPGRTSDHQIMVAVGKKAAGRLLDGVEHNGMPHVLEASAAA